MEKFTAESLLSGKLKLLQPENGYRYTIDPLILCHHVQPAPGDRILDIGCGCGIMPLLIGYRTPDTFITGIEIQTALASIAKKNIDDNQMDHQIHIVNKDISDLSAKNTEGRFDRIISNPPYKKADTGRLNPDPQKAVARHELKLTIQTLFAKAEELLRPKGTIMVIFPAERLFDICQATQPTSIRPEWIRFIHASPQKNAIRVIVSAVKNIKSSCRVRPPLYLYDSHGNPTKEYRTVINA